MKKNGKVELLRFIMAVVVMMHHSYDLNGGKYVIFGRGSLAVEFFFLLSGYFMAVSCAARPYVPGTLGESTTAYMIRKYKPLMPYLWISGFMALAVDLYTKPVHGGSDLLARSASMVYESLGLAHTGVRMYTVNGVVWYISAMLIALLLLYPVCKKYLRFFTRVIAPFVGVMLIGMLQIAFGTPTGPTGVVLSCIYRGTIRAVAEVCLGAALYPVVTDLRANLRRVTKLGRICFSLVELCAYLLSLYLMCTQINDKLDTFQLFLLMLALTLTLSEAGALPGLFNNRVCCILGRFALPLYLVHTLALRLLVMRYTEFSWGLFAMYCAGGVALGLLLELLVRLSRCCWGRLKGLFILPEA